MVSAITPRVASAERNTVCPAMLNSMLALRALDYRIDDPEVVRGFAALDTFTIADVVMGGVLEQEKSTYVESVPVLGDIPLIGALFRRRTDQDTPRYLLVFVTATIVKDNGEFLVYDDEASATNSPAVLR